MTPTSVPILGKPDEKARLLMLYPGPIHELSEYFTFLLEGLSPHYRGQVLALGDKPGLARIGEFDVTRVVVRDRLGVIDGLLDLRSRALALSRRHTFDAVVTYDPLKSGLVGWAVASRQGIPLIVEVNGDYTSPANYLDIPNPFRRWITRHAYIRLERYILRRSSGIKLLFPQMIDPFQDALRHPVVHTFSRVTDLSMFRNRGETMEVLFVGHPYRLKGVDLLIEAFKSVSDDFPDWRLKILGWFPDPRELEAAVDGHPQISVHPPVPRHVVAEHVGRCGIFVLPSRTEAQGRVLVEAMACGKPRIGANVGGIPTVINHGVDGLLFESEDSDQLADALARLMGDDQLRRKMGERSELRSRVEFTAEEYFERTRDLYDSVIREAKEGARAGLVPKPEAKGVG